MKANSHPGLEQEAHGSAGKVQMTLRTCAPVRISNVAKTQDQRIRTHAGGSLNRLRVVVATIMACGLGHRSGGLGTAPGAIARTHRAPFSIPAIITHMRALGQTVTKSILTIRAPWALHS